MSERRDPFSRTARPVIPGGETPAGEAAVSPAIPPVPPPEDTDISAPFEYHVVPFIGRIKNSAFSKDNAETVSAQLSDVIATVGRQGWEFYRIDQVLISVAPGCLGALFGKRAEIISFDQIVFRRPK